MMVDVDTSLEFDALAAMTPVTAADEVPPTEVWLTVVSPTEVWPTVVWPRVVWPRVVSPTEVTPTEVVVTVTVLIVVVITVEVVDTVVCPIVVTGGDIPPHDSIPLPTAANANVDYRYNLISQLHAFLLHQAQTH